MDFQIISILIALIAVVISVATLQQNRNMIEESTRPYIVVYNDIVTGASTPIQFLVIKNFGQIAGVITEFDIHPKIHVKYSDEMFKHIRGQIIAPSQSYTTAFKLDDSETVLTISISYSSKFKAYTDTFSISQKSISDHIHSKVSIENQDHGIRVIAGCLQDFLRSRL